MRSSVLAWSAVVSSAVALALAIVTAVQVSDRVDEFQHAVQACAANPAYTPGLQGQCLEDWLEANR
jgi:hypothetical protein